MPEAQAKVQAEAMKDFIAARELATKSDLLDLELRLTIRFGAMIAAAVAILAALMALMR